MNRTTILFFLLLSLLIVSCNEPEPTYEIRTKITGNLNIWKINDGLVRTMQTNNYTKWYVDIDKGSKTIFTGTTMNSFSGDIYGDNTQASITLSTTIEDDWNEWIYERGDASESVLYIRTAEKDNFNSLWVYNENNYGILEIYTINKNDFTHWNLQMSHYQSNVLTDPHYFGLYLIPVLIAVNEYY